MNESVGTVKELFGKSGLSASQKKCAELLVMKDVNKMNIIDIAKEIGVNRSTIFRWKQTKEFNDYMNALADEFQRSFLADAFGELRKIMAHGKPSEKLKAIELVLKNQGKLKENSEIVANITSDIDVDAFINNINSLGGV